MKHFDYKHMTDEKGNVIMYDRIFDSIMDTVYDVIAKSESDFGFDTITNSLDDNQLFYAVDALTGIVNYIISNNIDRVKITE